MRGWITRLVGEGEAGIERCQYGGDSWAEVSCWRGIMMTTRYVVGCAL